MRFPLLGVMLLVMGLTACGQGGDASKARESASSGRTTATTAKTDPWLAQLASYPQGEVSGLAPMQVQFTHPVTTAAELNQSLKGVVELDPALPATVVFVATNTLQITPSERWPAGRAFKLTLYPKQLDDVDKQLAPWVASLRVMRQWLDINVDGLAPADAAHMVLAGKLLTADVADSQAVEQVLSASQGPVALKLVWQHDDSGKTHSFTVTDIVRAKGAAPVFLNWDGRAIGLGDKGSREYVLPASPEDFSVTQVKVESDPEPHVRVQFSQTLDAGQNLAGLVSLDGKKARVRIDDSALDIYPEDRRKEGKVTLKLASGIRGSAGGRLDAELVRELVLSVPTPGVRFVGKGAILPQGKVLSVPIEAVAAKAVQVQAFEVFANNLPQYLQDRALGDTYADPAVGRWLWQKTIRLPAVPGQGWKRYELDLTELMASHPQGVVMLKLVVDRDSSTWACTGAQPAAKARLPGNYEGPGQSGPARSYAGDADYEYYDEADYEGYDQDAGYVTDADRRNPCTETYYNYNSQRVNASRAFFASNLGLIAKQGENNALLMFASWLDANTPASGVKLVAYNYQNQPLGQATTDGKGEASIALSGTAFYLLAEKGSDRGYLKLASNLALPSNQFDTGGARVEGGLKGMFYGERDVWRPGDDIHLTLVLNDVDRRLPAGYPIRLQWFNPRGEKVATFTQAKPVGQFYAFTLKTAEDAPTGNWRAVASVGQRSFETRLRIEAIKPNRLKIDLQAPALIQPASDNPISLHSQWLNGATAGALKADVKVRMLTRRASFKGLDGFDFNDPSRTLAAEPFTAFDAQLDAEGNARFNLEVPEMTPPGMATAVLSTRVFEGSGDYSTQIRNVPVVPYAHWVGLRVPKGSGWGDSLPRNKDSEISLLTVDAEGRPEAARALTLSVYNLDWSWWWDSYDDNRLANFVNSPRTYQIKQAALTSDAKGRAQWTLHGQDYDWGRYLIRVCQDAGKQCAGRVVYLGWSDAADLGGDAATRLALTTDKERYQVGDTAHVKVPVANGGRLLVSLESGDKVLSHYWLDVPKGQNTTVLDVPVTGAMAPNVYVNVSLLQPHRERDNDRPIRLYGIVPLLVTDPSTQLAPRVVAPAQVRPQSTFKIAISEQQGRPLTYTLAVVDEGLLGLTSFKTPALHDSFYQRVALGVRSWDLYDQVVGAYGGNLDRLLAVGGSDAVEAAREKTGRRFPPVVRFQGPFQLAKGETQQREVTLPAYMGQVRVMLVAGDGRAYGSAEQDITVTQPLTLLATLPRVLGPLEKLDLPVTVFAAKDPQGRVPTDVSVSAAAKPPVKITQGQAQLKFTQAGNQIALLGLEVGAGVGTADITVHAQSAGFQTQEAVHMPIRAANPPSTETQNYVLQKGETLTAAFTPHGVSGTNQGWLAVSRLPDMGLERRLDYLIEYPHGCVEQTISAVFPQLYLARLVNLFARDQARIQQNIDGAILRLRQFQTVGGGFGYWPGNGEANDWGSSYAGHFLIEAKRAGYAVPNDMLDNWKAWQQRQAQNLGKEPWDWSTQAYRLYTLALAGTPEVGAMNRLREALMNAAKTGRERQNGNLLAARWLLTAAYQQMGLNDIAAAMMPNQVSADYGEYWYYSFGSGLRDQAIAMQVRAVAGDTQGAWGLAKEVAAELASRRWYSTQSLAWALMNMARLAGADTAAQPFSFRWRDGKGSWQSVTSTPAVQRLALARPDQPREVSIANDSAQVLFVSVSDRGVPPPGGELATARGLELQFRFADPDGQPIDPARLKQGRDFVAEVTVKNTSGKPLRHVALTQILPSGWQITDSPREQEAQVTGDGAGDDEDQNARSGRRKAYDYRDLRDDRVMTYFYLRQGDSTRFQVHLNASFAGRFYLPSWQAEAMYDGEIKGATAGQWVEVVRQ